MAEKIGLELLSRIIANVESTIKELDAKETLYAIKRTKDIELAYSRTATNIKRAKEIFARTVDSQIFGKDN